MRHSLIFCRLLALTLFVGFVGLDARSTAAAPTYPLKRGTNPRFLVDQNDRPFLIQGDSPWSMMVQLTREETEEYLANRSSKGFNSIIVNLIEHTFSDNPPYNRYGQAPFTTPGDYSTPNPAYFDHVDWVLNKAAAYGIQVFLVPSYLGYGGGFDSGYPPQGWYQEMIANGPTKLRDYGRFLGQRYKNFPNIVWLHGGDYNPPSKDLVNAIAEGIREFDSNHLHTVHCAPETSALDFYSESWLGINNTYSYTNLLTKLRTDYSRTPASPFFMIESAYEGTSAEHPERNASPQDIRRQAYWSLLTGACGQFMGNNTLWGFFPGWRDAMNEGGSVGMTNLKKLMDSRSWWTFVPDLNNTIVVQGYGNPGSTDPSQYYVTAARTPGGVSLWAYVPTGRTIRVDMSRISGSSVKTWWYNPRTGAASSAGEFANVGLRDFTTPSSDGATQDWVLVADDASQNLPPPGTTATLKLTSAVSRKTHGSNAFDVALPGVEGRRGPNHTLAFTFSNSVTSGNASVTSGTGTVSGNAVVAGNTMTANLTGVTDGQYITVTLNNVTDGLGQTLPAISVTAGFLFGDTTGNGVVNATDLSQVKLHSGSFAQGGNFRNDVTVTGAINGTDVSQVKANVGNGLP